MVAHIVFVRLCATMCVCIYMYIQSLSVYTYIFCVCTAFEEAEKNAPAIIFIDELDAIAPKRDKVWTQTLIKTTHLKREVRVKFVYVTI